jgi:hypothetical protein
VIDTVAIKARFMALSPLLNERARRFSLQAKPARQAEVASPRFLTRPVWHPTRSTADWRNYAVRSLGIPLAYAGRGGCKPKILTEPGLLEALATLAQSAIRGDPEVALLWVSKSQRYLARALAELGFTACQKLGGDFCSATIKVRTPDNLDEKQPAACPLSGVLFALWSRPADTDGFPHCRDPPIARPPRHRSPDEAL